MRTVSPSVAAAAVTLALWLFPAPASAQLSVVETAGMRLVYLDPSETFLVPHAARTFLNSLAFQRRLFDFKPSDDIVLLLTDISDTGNAGASVVPRNAVTVEIAPLNFAFETIAGNDRMNILMNHELVHVATMDQAVGADRVFRKLFGGKVVPVPEHPESILYFLLTTPRVASPRWYHEGIAVFVDTWMAGGWGALRVPMTRWCSDRWCATGPRSTIRLASSRRGRRSTSRSRSTPICTGRAS